MDERLQDTLATDESVADRYAQLHDDRTAIAEIVERFLDAVEGDRVLDIGCGPGWETAIFENRGLDAVALDLSPSFLAKASERAPRSALFRADMRSLPLEPDRFDGLWACASLLHVPREEMPSCGSFSATGTRHGGTKNAPAIVSGPLTIGSGGMACTVVESTIPGHV